MSDPSKDATQAANDWLEARLVAYSAEFVPPPQPRGSPANRVWTRLWLAWCLRHWPAEFYYHAPGMIDLGETWMAAELIDQAERYLGADQ